MTDASFVVDNSIYPKTAILEAKKAFSKYLDVKITPKNTGNICISLKPFRNYEAQSREIILEFLNYALDYSIQLSMNSQNSK